MFKTRVRPLPNVRSGSFLAPLIWTTLSNKVFKLAMDHLAHNRTVILFLLRRSWSTFTSTFWKFDDLFKYNDLKLLKCGIRIHIRIRIHRPGRHLLGYGASVLKVSGKKCRTTFVVAKKLLDPSHIFANLSGGYAGRGAQWGQPLRPLVRPKEAKKTLHLI